MVAAAAPGLSLPGSSAQWALRTRAWSLGSCAPGGTRLVNSPGNGEMLWHVGHLSGALSPIVTVMEKARTRAWHVAARGEGAHGGASGRLGSVVHPAAGECGYSAEDVTSGLDPPVLSTVDKSENILWHHYPVGRLERQRLLGQRGCVVWITGLSGSGKSTLSCALSRELHARGYLSYILDGDNLRHGLNKNLSFSPTDRAENIRKIGEVAKLFADAGVICIASLISPYRRDRDACRALFPEATFIEVFLDMPLEVCELRDPKGLYKLARAGKIKGFTGIDDPYEPPQKCEITIQQVDGFCPSPATMVEQVLSFMEMNGYLQPDCNPSMVSC